MFDRIRTKLTARTYPQKLEVDRVARPHYGYCILKSAELAKILGYKKISIIEFGVAGGRGMLNIEYHIDEIKKIIDMDFEVYGFDSGAGMPKSTDPRDCTYLWFEGDFNMDKEKLLSRLKYSKLIFGDVAQTTRTFFDEYKPAPIACVFNDLDYYTSTLNSFNIFDTSSDNYLPRIPMYFDDVIGRFEFPMNDFVGELAAIHEYNRLNERKKIGKINELRHKRKVQAKWNEMIYVFQDFDHPKYNDPVRGSQNAKVRID